MTSIYKSILATSAACFLAGAAIADDMDLAQQDIEQVASACEIGVKLLPVANETDRKSDLYALPILAESQQEVTAIIVERAWLEEIPACENQLRKQFLADQKNAERFADDA